MGIWEAFGAKGECFFYIIFNLPFLTMVLSVKWMKFVHLVAKLVRGLV